MKRNPTPIFSLIKTENSGKAREIIGSIVYYATNIVNIEGIANKENPYFLSEPVFEFRPEQKYLNKEENFICSVNQGDIINIRSEYTENMDNFVPNDDPDKKYGINIFFTTDKGEKKNFFTTKPFLHLATLTFLFKEISFPNILELDPLND